MDFSDQPKQLRPFPLKLALIIGGGVVVAIGIIIGVIVFTHKTSPQPSPSKGEGARVVGSVLPQCESVGNPEACQDYVLKQAALENKDVKGCEGLSDVSKDDCVYGIAVALNDANMCKQIKDQQNAQSCRDLIATAVAVAAGDSSQCDKLSNDGVKSNCQNAILSTTTVENCATRKQDPAYCNFLTIVAKATKAQDPAMCNVLYVKATKETSEMYRCRDRVPINDPDFDGLSTDDEVNIYKTDPRKADTDGDGYADGAEVRTGHDPLKK